MKCNCLESPLLQRGHCNKEDCWCSPNSNMRLEYLVRFLISLGVHCLFSRIAWENIHERLTKVQSAYLASYKSSTPLMWHLHAPWSTEERAGLQIKRGFACEFMIALLYIWWTFSSCPRGHCIWGDGHTWTLDVSDLEASWRYHRWCVELDESDPLWATRWSIRNYRKLPLSNGYWLKRMYILTKLCTQRFCTDTWFRMWENFLPWSLCECFWKRNLKLD